MEDRIADAIGDAFSGGGKKYPRLLQDGELRRCKIPAFAQLSGERLGRRWGTALRKENAGLKFRSRSNTGLSLTSRARAFCLVYLGLRHGIVTIRAELLRERKRRVKRSR